MKDTIFCFTSIHTYNTHVIVGPCFMAMNLIKKLTRLYFFMNIRVQQVKIVNRNLRIILIRKFKDFITFEGCVGMFIVC